MLLKVRQLDIVNPKTEVGKERLPVEILESILFVDTEEIMSVVLYVKHSDAYLESDQIRARNAIIEKYGKEIQLCRINMKHGWYFGNVFACDLLPKLQIDENGLQGNVAGQMS